MPEGLANYQVPPPNRYLEPAISFPLSNGVESAKEPPVESVNHDFYEMINPLIDLEKDRTYDMYTGRKIKALYENGWFTGTIKYYNKLLHEYNVVYSDDTGDYISIQYIDSVEVQLIWH